MTYPFGVHYGLSDKIYHALDEIEGRQAVSSSKGKAVLSQSIAHAFCEKTYKDTPAFQIGRAVHAWAGENILPIKGGENRRGNPWKEAAERAEKMNVVCLTDADYERVSGMVDALHESPQIGFLLGHKDKVAEASIFAAHDNTSLALKARPDLMIQSQGIVVDLKTTISAEPYEFERQMYKLKYAFQAAWYKRTLELAGLRCDRFLFANVEKEPPYATSLVEVGPELMAHSLEQVEQILLKIEQAIQTETYATGWPAVHVAQLPAWLG